MNIKVGILLPRSVIYPSIGFDLVGGFRAGLEHFGLDSVDIITTGIGVAAKNDEIYAKAEQMLLDGAEVILAYINPVTAEAIHPLFQNTNRLLMVLDSGYHFPTNLKKLSNALYISLQGNLCCRVVTKYAIEKGNKNFAYTCSFYDAGYRSNHSFIETLTSNGGHITYNHVTPLKRKEFTLQPLLDSFDIHSTDAVLASFCGDMTEDFIREGAAHNLFSNYKVFGSSFMAEELWLDKIKHPGNDFTCAIPWSKELDNEENIVFVNTLEASGKCKATVFSLLTWEASALLKELLSYNATDFSFCLNELEGFMMDSPRGKIKIDVATHIVKAPVYIADVTKNEENGCCKLSHIREVNFIEDERKKLFDVIETFNTPTSTWLNAYACLDS